MENNKFEFLHNDDPVMNTEKENTEASWFSDDFEEHFRRAVPKHRSLTVYMPKTSRVKTFFRKPAVAAIAERTGLDPKQLSPAMREVIWSTAVQHGPAGAARLFDRANSLSGEQDDPAYERKLINNVYKLRAGQFGSSSTQVQAAVQNRFREERLLALNMLDAGKSTALA